MKFFDKDEDIIEKILRNIKKIKLYCSLLFITGDSLLIEVMMLLSSANSK